VDRLPPRGVVATALFLMAWGLESRSLARALARPWPALWAVALSYGALPPLALAAGRLLPLVDLRVGLLISASVPCTLASAVLWTRMARGSEATALLVVLVSTCTSWLVTTAWLVGATGAGVSVPTADMMAGLLLVLVLPVGLGQLCRAAPPLARLAARGRTVIGVAARLLVLSIILKAAVDVSRRLDHAGSALPLAWLLPTAGICVGTHLAALATGLWSSGLLGFARPERIAVAFACSQKTLPVALVLFTDYFQQSYPLAVVPLVFYHVGQLVVDTFIADALAARGARGA
jgi:sodium/bile acid cotransporter 7